MLELNGSEVSNFNFTIKDEIITVEKFKTTEKKQLFSLEVREIVG